jgi:hypothetical protein
MPSHYISAYQAFMKDFRRDRLYLKTDSHFGLWGACVCVTEIMLKIAADFPSHEDEFRIAINILSSVPTVWEENKIVSGDLTSRFFGVRLYEKDFDIELERLFGFSPRLELVSSYEPLSGTTGIKKIWRNPDAPIKLRVAVFGNSFFERGTASTTLGWWFKYFFEEFHFIWAREVIYEYVDEYKPDLVICQSIERFLPVVPLT